MTVGLCVERHETIMTCLHWDFSTPLDHFTRGLHHFRCNMSSLWGFDISYYSTWKTGKWKFKK